MQDKATTFVQRVHGRNLRETVVGLALAAWVAFDVYDRAAPTLATAGRIGMILGVLVTLAVIWGKLHIPAAEVSDYPPDRHPDRWKRHMTVQAQWLRLAWLWYVLPLFAAAALSYLGRSTVSDVAALVFVVVGLAIAAGVAWLNVLAAKGIERDRDAWFGQEVVA